MKREIRRETDLPPFDLGLPELELLWIRLESLFENCEYISKSLDMEFTDEKLSFDSIEEIQAEKFSHNSSVSFNIYFSGSGRRIHLRTPSMPGSPAKLIVTAESEIWAAGVREVVLTVINQNKAWHHWVRPKLISGMLLLGMLATTVSTTYMEARNLTVEKSAVAGVAGTLAVLALLFFGRQRILPIARLRLKTSESLWRKYSVELTLLLALVSALLTAYGVFAPKSVA